METTRDRGNAGTVTGESGARAGEAAQGAEDTRSAGKSIGALYRRMSGWYIVFSIVVFLFILFVGFQLARPLLPHLFEAGG